MSSVTYMTLKVLYSIDDGLNNNYLARSSEPVRVQVMSIPLPYISNHGNNNVNTNNNNNSMSNSYIGQNDQYSSNSMCNYIKIGAVKLSHVLKEIQSSSPELLLLQNTSNVVPNTKDCNTTGTHTEFGMVDVNSYLKQNRVVYDYNVYYRDICEEDEPLVSLGILSKIRTSYKQDEEEEEEEKDVVSNNNDDQPMVVGRVCPNFAALVAKPNGKLGNVSTLSNPSAETLEVKIRFSRIPVGVTSSSFKSADNTNAIKGDYTPTLNTKRKTNKNLAPKAERTLSLPVWNANIKSNPTNQELFTASIAHKIYLADRQSDHQIVHDGTHDYSDPNSATKDSIASGSVQFRNHQHQQQEPAVMAPFQNYPTSTMPYRSGNSSTRQRIRADQDDVSKRFEFMLNKKKPSATTKNKHGSIKKPKKKVLGKSSRGKSKHSNVGGKENFAPLKPPPLPPILPPQTHDTQSPTHKPLNNSVATTAADTALAWFPNTAAAPAPTATITNIDISSGTTPNDIPTMEDPDRTSPIDTLSMPLMEFEQDKVSNIKATYSEIANSQEQSKKKGKERKKKIVSCQEQLKRIPLLSQRKQPASVTPTPIIEPTFSTTTATSGQLFPDFNTVMQSETKANCTDINMDVGNIDIDIDMDMDTAALGLKLDNIDEMPIFDIGSFSADFNIDDNEDGLTGAANDVPHSICVSEISGPDSVSSGNDLLATELIMDQNEVMPAIEGGVGEEIEDVGGELEEEEEEEEEEEKRKRRAMPSSPGMIHAYDTPRGDVSTDMDGHGTGTTTATTTTTTTAASADVMTIAINNEDEEDDNDEDDGEASANSNELLSLALVNKQGGTFSTSSDIMDSDLQGQDTPATTVRYASSDMLDNGAKI